MTGAIAIAASLTPYMQKGNVWARNTHIAINGNKTVYICNICVDSCNKVIKDKFLH
jgi:ATP-dependent protease Clp ATPase subunit